MCCCLNAVPSATGIADYVRRKSDCFDITEEAILFSLQSLDNASHSALGRLWMFSVALRPQRLYGLLGTGSPGRPPPLSHSSVFVVDDDDELMLNVLRCHLTY